MAQRTTMRAVFFGKRERIEDFRVSTTRTLPIKLRFHACIYACASCALRGDPQVPNVTEALSHVRVVPGYGRTPALAS